MKVIGRINAICGRRLMIVRCDAAQLPKLYSVVVNQRMHPIGKIMDLFGNVSKPYATVLCQDQCTSQPGEKVFAR